MKEFFSVEGNLKFELFDLIHLTPIFLTIILIFLIYLFKDSVSKSIYEPRIRYIYATLLFINEISIYIWRYFNGLLDVTTLPFELCSYTIPLTSLLLITKKKGIHDITFFWGIGGGIAALLTPNIRQSYDNYRYYQFMIGHGSIVFVSFYMLYVHKFIPTFKSYLKSYLMLIVVGVYAIIFNNIFKTNYMGLAGGFGEPTLIDYMGPYPINIFVLGVLGLILFYIIYLPIKLTYHKN